MENYRLDSLDEQILSLIANNARIPFLEVARECNVSGAAIHQRIQKLVNMGVIKGSEFVLDPEKVGYETCAYVGIYLKDPSTFDSVLNALKAIPEVVECHFVTGKHNLLIKLYCFDHDHLMQVLLNTIQKIPYVQQTETQISLDQAIERQVWVKEYQNTSFSASVRKKKKETK